MVGDGPGDSFQIEVLKGNHPRSALLADEDQALPRDLERSDLVDNFRSFPKAG